MTVLAAVFFLYTLYLAWNSRDLFELRSLDNPPDPLQAMFPPRGEPTPADQYLTKQVQRFAALPSPPSIDSLPGQPKTFSTEQIRKNLETLESRREFHQGFLAGASPDLETAGFAPILQSQHDLNSLRELSTQLSLDVLSLLSQSDPFALPLLESLERCTRILERGTENRTTVIGPALASHSRKRFDSGIRNLIQTNAISAKQATATSKILKASLSKPFPMDLAIRAEYDFIRGGVRLLDERLGLLQYPMRLYWGDGQTQLDEALARQLQGFPPIEDPGNQKLHMMVQIGLPNFDKLLILVEEQRKNRTQLVQKLGEIAP